MDAACIWAFGDRFCGDGHWPDAHRLRRRRP